MSITVSAELDTILDGVEQDVWGVQVSLDLDVFTGLPVIDFSTTFTQPIASVSLSAQNGTDLPDEVRDVVGFTALGGELVLAGPIGPLRKESMAWLLNPDNTASPLYRRSIKGMPVTVDIGYRVPGSSEPEWVRKLTGSVAALASLDHDAGTVTLDLVDASVDYDSTPLIPGVATGAPFNAGLTSEFPMDQIIRSKGNGSSWPAQRANCIFAAGMRSTVWPEVGTLNTVDSRDTPAFSPGLYGSALTDAPSLNYNPAAPVHPADSVFIEYFGTGNVTVDVADALEAGSYTNILFSLNLGGGYCTASIGCAAGGDHFSIISPTDGLPHYYAAAFTWAPGSTSWTVALTIDTTTITHTGTAPGPRSTTATAPIVAASVGYLSTLQGVQVTTETAPTPNLTFTPLAVLDTSLNPLTVIPEIPAGSKGSDELQTIAAAELGYARFDEFGVFRFTNRLTIATQPVTRDITADTALKPGLTTTVGASTEYDHVQVPFTAWAPAAPAAPAALFTLAEVKQIPPHRTTSWTQPLGATAVNIDTTVTLLANGHNPGDGGSYYRASTDVYGTHAHPGLAIAVTVLSSGTVKIDVTNPTSLTAWLTTPGDTYTDLTAGSASSGLWIGGTPLVAADEALTDSVYGAGTKPALVIASNPYLQVQDAAQALGDYLLPQLIVAVRDFTGTAVLPDPRIQITDKVHLIEPYRAGIDEYAYVWGSSFTAEFAGPGETGGTWSMDLDLRALGPPGAWLLGIPGRSELGDSTTGATGTAWLYGGT